MAYQITRKASYTQTLELLDESGRIAHVIKVSVDPYRMAEQLSRQYTEILRAYEKASKVQSNGNPQEVLQAYGELGGIVETMMKAVFGETDTQVILEFYGDNYGEVIENIVPFISNVLLPELRRLSQEKRKETLQNYDRNKKEMKKNGIFNRYRR